MPSQYSINIIFNKQKLNCSLKKYNKLKLLPSCGRGPHFGKHCFILYSMQKTTSAIDCNIIINVKKNRFFSAAKLALKVQEDHNITVTPQTIRNRIRE